MKRTFLVVAFLMLSFVDSFAYKYGGILLARPDNIGIIQGFDEGIRSMADWYDSYQGKSTDSGVITCPTKFGDSMLVKGFWNNRDSTIMIKMLFENTRTDTNFFLIPSCTYLGKLPSVWKFWVVGYSLDSTNVFRQKSK
jgi:hypothetical protein